MRIIVWFVFAVFAYMKERGTTLPINSKKQMLHEDPLKSTKENTSIVLPDFMLPDSIIFIYPMNTFYTREFELYAEKTLQEYRYEFFSNDLENSNQNRLLVFSRNLISFSRKLNEKALDLHTAASRINPNYNSDSEENVFTLGTEYIKKFTNLYKH